MRKILFVNPDNRHTCSFYRSAGITKNLLRQLGSDYTIDIKSWPDVEVGWDGIGQYDMVMFQRPYTASMVKFCKHVKMMNVKLWVDNDDNLFSVTPENRSWPIYNDPNTQSLINEVLQLADVVSVTTDHLKKDYSKLNDNIVVVPNAFNDDFFDIDRELPERDKQVLWRGSDTHIYDLMAHATAITDSTVNNPTWEYTYIGFNPWFMPENKNTVYIKPMDIMDYFEVGMQIKPAVVQIPLFDTDFNRCKSNIGFIEASYWGAVSLVPEWWGEIPGTITYTDVDSYYEGLRKVIDGEVDVVSMNKAARKYVKENLMLTDINKLRVQIVKSQLGE